MLAKCTMKKFIALILFIFTLLSAVACAANPDTPAPVEPVTPAVSVTEVVSGSEANVSETDAGEREVLWEGFDAGVRIRNALRPLFDTYFRHDAAAYMACFTDEYHAEPGKETQAEIQEYMDYFDAQLDLAASENNKVYVYDDERIEFTADILYWCGETNDEFHRFVSTVDVVLVCTEDGKWLIDKYDMGPCLAPETGEELIDRKDDPFVTYAYYG